jgi:hypothetical protein
MPAAFDANTPNSAEHPAAHMLPGRRRNRLNRPTHISASATLNKRTLIIYYPVSQ